MFVVTPSDYMYLLCACVPFTYCYVNIITISTMLWLMYENLHQIYCCFSFMSNLYITLQRYKHISNILFDKNIYQIPHIYLHLELVQRNICQIFKSATLFLLDYCISLYVFCNWRTGIVSDTVRIILQIIFSCY